MGALRDQTLHVSYDFLNNFVGSKNSYRNTAPYAYANRSTFFFFFHIIQHNNGFQHIYKHMRILAK